MKVFEIDEELAWLVNEHIELFKTFIIIFNVNEFELLSIMLAENMKSTNTLHV